MLYKAEGWLSCGRGRGAGPSLVTGNESERCTYTIGRAGAIWSPGSVAGKDDGRKLAYAGPLTVAAVAMVGCRPLVESNKTMRQASKRHLAGPLHRLNRWFDLLLWRRFGQGTGLRAPLRRRSRLATLLAGLGLTAPR